MTRLPSILLGTILWLLSSAALAFPAPPHLPAPPGPHRLHKAPPGPGYYPRRAAPHRYYRPQRAPLPPVPRPGGLPRP